VNHNGAGSDALFEVEYTTGDRVWLPYHEVSRLEAVGQYLEALGVRGIRHLPKKISGMPAEILTSNIKSFTDARQCVFGIVDEMLENFADGDSTPGAETRGISSLVPSSPPSSLLSPIPNRGPVMTPPSSFEDGHDPMTVDSPTFPPPRELGEIPQSDGTRGHPPSHGKRRRGGCGGRRNKPYEHDSNTAALDALTLFLRAEANEREFNTKWKTYDFDQLVRSE